MAALEPAYVLHTRPWRETSLILELLTRESGRLGVVGRGLRRPRRGSVPPQPFSLMEVTWRGRGELRTLTGHEVERLHPLQGDALYAGLYLNEILVRLLQREDPHPEVFDAYAQTLAALASGAPLEPALRRFELLLLDALGYGFPLDLDITGRPLRADAVYRVEPDAGLVEEALRDGESGGLLLSATLLEAIAAGDLELPEVAQAAKRLTRHLLAPHLGPRPLRSRALFAGRRAGQETD